MNYKLSKFVLTCFLFAFLIGGMPAIANAETSNVIDWIDEDETNQTITNDDSDSVIEDKPKDKSFAAVIGQLFFYTLLIVLMIYGLIKFLALRQKNLQPNQAIKRLGGTSLGTNKSLQIVKIGGKVYVLGVSDSINLIKELTDEEEISLIEEELNKQPVNTVIDILKEKVVKRNTSPSNASFQQLFNQSLTKLKMKQERFQSDLNENNEDKEGRS